MTNAPDPHPSPPASAEADPEKQTTPAGMTHDLEDLAAEQGATVDGAPADVNPTDASASDRT